jgi:hypothetical protein
MPKVTFTCERCSTEFAVFPAYIRYVESRGSRVKFCSRKCTDEARAAGLIGSRKRTGENVTCAICGTVHYRKPNRLRRNTLHFCSEPCRIEAIRQNLTDRKFDQASEKKRTGSKFRCLICGTEKYQKRSYIARNVDKTCGKRSCISAYSRSLWGLPPRSDEERRIKRSSPQKARETNFTGAQRAQWIDTSCTWCGSTENLCLDHTIPVAAGGKSVRSNAQTLCQPCNVWKGNHVDRPMAKAFNNLHSGG